MDMRKYSKLQETNISKAVKGKVQSNSGATNFMKGDVDANMFLLEAKTQVTEKKSMRIMKEWISKIKEESFAMGKPFWSVVFNFGGLGNKENYYIIDEKLFVKLMNMLKEEN